jgi:hypothetical protein
MHPASQWGMIEGLTTSSGEHRAPHFPPGNVPDAPIMHSEEWLMMNRRRRLLILLLGFSGLIAITLLGSSLETLIPRPPSAATQRQEAGPYQVTLQVSPNPPSLTEPADLTLQIVQRQTQQLVTSVHVEVDVTMEAMEMGNQRVNTVPQNNGMYQARYRFLMHGVWTLHVLITETGKADQEVMFDVTA